MSYNNGYKPENSKIDEANDLAIFMDRNVIHVQVPIAHNKGG